MNLRQLGRSDLRVSPLCLGTMMFGGATDEATSHRIIARAKDGGVNFIDTADAYNAGRSEEVIGRGVRQSRNHFVIATKVYNKLPDNPASGGLSRRWIMQAAEDSLRRLGIGHIDLYYLHKEDHTVPLEETVRAIADLVRAGKIRYFGVSNYRAWRIAEICRLCDEIGINRPVASQPYYHAMYRVIENEHLPACGYFGLGVFCYSPLARGLLTGKYAPGAAPAADSRAGRKDARIMETEFRPEALAAAQKIKQHAEKRGTTATKFAIGWVLNNRLMTGIVGGPRTEAQWEDYLSGFDYKPDAEDEAFIDSIVSPGHPAMPGYNDPGYPIEGRVVA
jgi:aryl-alcohol dehydrogenase (NADP+)